MVSVPLKISPLFLQVPSEVTLTVTPEQFTALAAANSDLRLERTTKGQLIVNPPAGSESGRRNLSLSGQLYRWHENNNYPGEMFDSSTGFTLPNGAIRSPDASWVCQEKWDALTSEQKKGFAPLCPDFVVELRSETDNLTTLRQKMQEYLDNGAKLGWLINPQANSVERVHLI